MVCIIKALLISFCYLNLKSSTSPEKIHQFFYVSTIFIVTLVNLT